MKDKIKYTDEPLGKLSVIEDFLPLMDEVINDPEAQREMQRKKDEWERQRLDIISRPRSGPMAPTDGELLNLMSKGFDLFCETPFGNDYDHLLERLSFTDKTFDSEDAGMLKTAWTRFLNEVDIAFGWPLSEGMAGWYEEREMYAHAIAVYEHLYTLVRQGELEHGDFDQRLDSSERSFLETWLIRLVHLYYRRKQPERARHLYHLIEDYYIDGYVSLVGSAEALAWEDELSRAASTQQFSSDQEKTRTRLKSEYVSFDDLHEKTKEFVVGAELWGNKHWHWIKINPWIAPLRWAQAIESEFHHKVFKLKRDLFKNNEENLGVNLPRHNQECSLGQIIKVIENAGSNNLGLKCLFAEIRNSQFLASQDTLVKLKEVCEVRNRIAHPSEKGAYTSEKCRDFLREIRETNWVFDFLDALQPRNSSTRN